jgi:hypothetical protein
MNKQGLNKDQIAIFLSLMRQANNEQLNMMRKEALNEQLKRTPFGGF